MSVKEIDDACRIGHDVRARVGTRDRRIAGAVATAKGKHFARGMVWVNFWGSVEWRQVALSAVYIRQRTML